MSFSKTRKQCSHAPIVAPHWISRPVPGILRISGVSHQRLVREPTKDHSCFVRIRRSEQEVLAVATVSTLCCACFGPGSNQLTTLSCISLCRGQIIIETEGEPAIYTSTHSWFLYQRPSGPILLIKSAITLYYIPSLLFIITAPRYLTIPVTSISSRWEAKHSDP